MNRLPVLVVTSPSTSEEVRIGQSKAIERYIAHTYNMYGNTPIETALIDNINENIRDIREKWSKIRAIGMLYVIVYIYMHIVV